MRKVWKVTGITLMLGVVLTLAACSNKPLSAPESGQPGGERTDSAYEDPPEDAEDMADPLRIPSETGEKTETTNEYGTTSKGMGNNIYSTIGTSGIHEGGVSSYFESVLEGEGIKGVKVFVVDDAVVLARNKPETTSHEYDDMQDKVLNGTKGQTSTEDPQAQQKEQDDNNSLDNMDQAENVLNDLFNDDVKMLSVTDPDAVDLISDIKDNIKSSDYEKASDNMVQLLEMAE